jgi:hypothetical protein
MKIKSVMKSVSSLFDSQKGVVRADDAKLPAALAANAVEKSAVPSLDLSGLRRAGKTAVRTAAPKIVASAPVVALAQPATEVPTAPVVPASAPVLAPAPAVPVRAVHQTVAEESLAAMLSEIVKKFSLEDIQRALQQASTERTAAPVAAEPETPEQTAARLDADLAKAVRDRLERGRGPNPQAAITHGPLTSKVHEYRRR